MPQFSVLIPAFNASETINSTLDALLAQDSEAIYDVIVCNDGSTDNTQNLTEERIADFAQIGVELILISQENRGAAAALEAAARRSRSEFIIRLDADDRLTPNHISAVQSFIVEQPGFDIYASNARYFSEEGLLAPYHPHKAPYDSVFSLSFDDLVRANLVYGTAAIRREYFEKVGGFDERFYNEDYQLWLKLLAAGARHIYQPKELSLYRVRTGQKTGDALRVRADDIEILRSFLSEENLAKSSKDLIEKRIKALELNLRIRTALYRIIGKEFSESIIRFLRG